MNRSWVQVVRGALNLPAVRELRRLANRYRPRFEQLEDRWTPAKIFMVISPLDDPLGPATPGVYTTLRDAINEVNADTSDSAASPDVIQFAIPGGTPITLTADLPAISRPVYIDGSTQGAGGVTIVGSDNLGNVYSALDAESAVSLKAVTISGGTLTVGAGSTLNVDGDLGLGDSAVVRNFGSLQVTGSVVAGPNVGINDYDGSAFDVTGDFTMDYGGYVYNGADFTSSDSATFVVGGSLRIGANGILDNVGDSSVSVGNDLAIGDSGFIFNGISDADSAVLTVGGSVSLGADGDNAAYIRNNGTSFFQVAGDVTLLGDMSYVFNGTDAADAATFQVGGTFALPGDSDAAYNYGNGTFSVGGLQLGAAGNFYNHSILSVNGSAATGTSTLHLFAGGSLDVASGADFTVDSGGAILADKGTRVTIEGDLTIDAGATASVDLLALSDEALVDIFGALSANTEVIEGHSQAIVETGGDDSSRLTIRITPYSATYDGTTHEATGTATGANGEDLSGLLAFRGTDHVNAGNYAGDTWTFLGNSVYGGVTGSIDDEIAKADQTITVTQAAPTTATYGASFTVSATASSGLGVGIAAGGVGAGSGTGSASISMTSGTGSASVTFSQAGNENYNAATVVVENVTAQKANQTITVSPSAPASAASGAKFTVSATSSSGLAVSIAASGALSGSGVGSAAITVAGTSGSGTVTFSQLGDANFNPATMVVETTTVASTTPVTGAGITVVGNSLYVVGGARSNDQIEISAIGRSNTGSTGVKVTAVLDGKRVTTTFNQSFATIYVTGYAGNDNIELASTLTIATVVHLGNGNHDVTLGNGNNTVALGSGNNRIEAGNGTNVVTIGSAGVGGNNVVALGNGSRDVVTIAGNGNNSVVIGKGDNDAVTILGKGTNSVLIGDGKHDVVTLGDGAFAFRIGGVEWFLHLGARPQRTHACHGWRFFAAHDRR